MSYLLSVIVFALTATPGVCERASFDELVADATSSASTDNATIVAKSYVYTVASRPHVPNHYHANASQSLVLSPRSSGRAVTGSVLLAVGGQWKPSEVLLLVFNMISELFGQANAAFTAAQALISVSVPDDLFQAVSDSISNAFGSGFGVSTAGLAAAKDMKSLCTKLSAFKWNDPAYARCPTLNRATAMLDMMLDFLSFAANVASFLGDNLWGIAPPVNLWLSAGGRIAGGIIWVLQTFVVPTLLSQSCDQEGRDDADAMYAEANGQQTAKIQRAKEKCGSLSRPDSFHPACKEEEQDTTKTKQCQEDEMPKSSDDPGKPCRPWSSWRFARCYKLKEEEFAMKESACRAADGAAQLQVNVISVISTARKSAIEEYGITGEEAITQATATRHGGVGGSQLAGQRDLGSEKRSLVKHSVTGEMVWASVPTDSEKTQLRVCCKDMGICMHTVDMQTNEDSRRVAKQKCTDAASTCLKKVDGCAGTKKSFCEQAYFSELSKESPCCTRREKDHCIEAPYS